MKVHAMWMIASVGEFDTNHIAFRTPQGGARYASVIRPGRELNARHDLDILVDDDDFVFAQGSAIRQGGDLAIIEIGQDISRVESVLLMVNVSGAGRKSVSMIYALHRRHECTRLIFSSALKRNSRATCADYTKGS